MAEHAIAFEETQKKRKQLKSNTEALVGFLVIAFLTVAYCSKDGSSAEYKPSDSGDNQHNSRPVNSPNHTPIIGFE